MANVIVKIGYTNDAEIGHIYRFELTKTFNFKNLPLYNGIKILLKDDAIDSLKFNVISYDPEDDIYHVYFTINEGVSRYYHGNALEIMEKVNQRFKEFGWEVKRLN